MTSTSFYLKYRPNYFNEVIGQEAVIKSLKGLVDKKSAHAFLFSGPSGTGKTTLSRIAAYEFGCKKHNIIELDAATHTGIDSMRGVQEILRHMPFDGRSRALIIDEAHGMSKQAWDSLLKVVEEPPKNTYWFFCTTNVSKVPATVKTRCAAFTMKGVAEDALEKIVERVLTGEKIKLAEGVKTLIVREANGSPRQALANLMTCQTAGNRAEAAKLLQTALESDPTIELCRLLFTGGSWQKAMGIMKKFGDGDNPEDVRIIVCNYMASVLKNATAEAQVMRTLAILEAFSVPYNTSEKMAPLYLSVGKVIYGN